MPTSKPRATEGLPASLSPTQREVVESLLPALAAVPGVVAVALGGSHARGFARPGSDVDLGLYYRREAPLGVKELRRLAGEVAGDTAGSVTELGEWGPWVDGGAWLRIRGESVDWIYREIEKIAETLDAALRGEIELHFGQQPPSGFHSHTLLAELNACQILWAADPSLASLKERVRVYPGALRRSIVRSGLAHVDFTLFFARAGATRGDVSYTARCLARAATYLDQVLFALNEAWFANDKTAGEEIAAFDVCPGGYVATWAQILGACGSESRTLTESVERADAVFRAVVALDPDGFAPRFLAGKPGG